MGTCLLAKPVYSQGSLATESAVLKLSGKQFEKPFSGPVSHFEGPSLQVLLYLYRFATIYSAQARVFDGENGAYDAIMSGKVCVCVCVGACVWRHMK